MDNLRRSNRRGRGRRGRAIPVQEDPIPEEHVHAPPLGQVNEQCNTTDTKKRFSSNKAKFRLNNGNNMDSRENGMTTSTSNQIVDDQRSSAISRPSVGLEASSSFTREIGSTAGHKKSVNARQRKVRGPTRNLKLVRLPPGIRFEVSWRKKRPVGDNADIFKSQCTVLARQVDFTPLQVKSWKAIDIATKKKLFETILERFKVEGQERSVLLQIHRSYNNWRDSLKKTWLLKHDTVAKALANIPEEITKEDAKYLAKLWKSREYQEMCERNKKNRSNLNIYHTCGSRSIQQRVEKEVRDTNKEPSRIEVWELTHLKSNGMTVNETTQEKMVELNSYASQVVDGTLDMNENEIFVQVFGPEKNGRVRGYGVGVTPSELFGWPSNACDLERRLQESEQRLHESERQRKVEVQELKDQMVELENRFEDRFQTMMAEMCKQFG